MTSHELILGLRIFRCRVTHTFLEGTTLLLYHLVFPAKYRRKVFDESVDKTLKSICLEIADRYEIHFIEKGNDLDHVHFLVQSVPMLSVTKIVTIIETTNYTPAIESPLFMLQL